MGLFLKHSLCSQTLGLLPRYSLILPEFMPYDILLSTTALVLLKKSYIAKTYLKEMYVNHSV